MQAPSLILLESLGLALYLARPTQAVNSGENKRTIGRLKVNLMN